MLATVADYLARLGDPGDHPTLEQLLVDAGALVRQVARIHISEVADDEVVLDGDGTVSLLLPNIPVADVTAVTVDGEALAADAWRWWDWGRLERLDGRVWPCAPRSVKVTYSHGTEVPDWVVNLVCGMVQRAQRESAVNGYQQQSAGPYAVTYSSGLAAGGTVLWLTETERNAVAALRGPVIA